MGSRHNEAGGAGLEGGIRGERCQPGDPVTALEPVRKHDQRRPDDRLAVIDQDRFHLGPEDTDAEEHAGTFVLLSQRPQIMTRLQVAVGVINCG